MAKHGQLKAMIHIPIYETHVNDGRFWLVLRPWLTALEKVIKNYSNVEKVIFEMNVTETSRPWKVAVLYR